MSGEFSQELEVWTWECGLRTWCVQSELEMMSLDLD